MQKIGLIKCKSKNLKYYNKIYQSKNIVINDENLNNISSTIINTEIVHKEFNTKSSCAKILLKINLKLIYSILNSNSLYVLEKDFLTVSYIDIPNVVQGVSTQQAFIQNKIKPEVFVENITTKIINNKKVISNFYIITNLLISPSFYFSYIIDNGLFDNIFSSFSDGKNLSQNTFTSNVKYIDLKWKSQSSTLVFTNVKEDKTTFTFIDFNCKNEYRIRNVNVCGFVNIFNFIDNNKIVFDLTNENGSFLYNLNLKNNEIKKINYPNLYNKCTKPYFDKNIKRLYFLCLIENINTLCYLDKKDNFESIFNFSNVYDYIISICGEKILIKTLTDNKYKLFLLNISSNYLEPVNLDFDYDEIIKMDFYRNNNSYDDILVLYKLNNCTYLTLYNLSTLESSTLFDECYINDFTIDYHTRELFIATKGTTCSKVLKINSNSYDVILKLPSNIKKLCSRT